MNVSYRSFLIHFRRDNQEETLYTSFSCNIVNSDLLFEAQPLNSAAIVLKSKTLFYVAGLPGLGVAH